MENLGFFPVKYLLLDGGGVRNYKNKRALKNSSEILNLEGE